MKKTLTIVTGTYNEVGNINILLDQIITLRNSLVRNYDIDVIVIDNDSVDGTRKELLKYAKKYNWIRLIFNKRNFGHLKSPYYAITQSKSLYTVYLASDLQDPVLEIPNLLKKIEHTDDDIVLAKRCFDASYFFNFSRLLFYKIFNFICDFTILENSTGFGIYRKNVIEVLRSIHEPYPFLRGLISELGFKISFIEFNQGARVNGVSKNNIFTLYDLAINGIIFGSRNIIRYFCLLSFFLSFILFLISVSIFIFKIFYWYSMPFGYAPFLILFSLVFSSLFFILGLIGENLSAIKSYTRNIPLIVEHERINFK